MKVCRTVFKTIVRLKMSKDTIFFKNKYYYNMKNCSNTLESLRIPVTISQASHNLFQTVGTSTRMDRSSRNQHGNILYSGIFLWLYHTSFK